MEKILEALAALLPIASLIQNLLGFTEETSKAIAALINASWVAIGLYYLKKVHTRYINSQTAKNLQPQFDYGSIQDATQYYIPTQFQNVSPTKEDEPADSDDIGIKTNAIPHFLKKAFNKKDRKRFYIILADSGMGKTTFMVNLYMQYVSFWNRHRDKNIDIKLFRLGNKETLSLVKEIKREKAINTILLLDALDEDPYILPQNETISDEEAFRQRVDEIIEATQHFREVVMTCRTQYFPGQENDPYELRVKRPDGGGYYIFKKFYISPFETGEVKQYLNKKYPFWKIWQRKKKQNAAQIIKNSPKLTVRPMLLSYIDDLLTEEEDTPPSYDTTYAIYEALIEKWLIREAKKRKYLKEQGAFIKNLRELSQHAALVIYQKHLDKTGLFLTKEEALTIAKTHNIQLKPNEVTGQSLFTCDGQSSWKFAHKSILEFFIAQHANKELSFFLKLAENGFAGMDMVKFFYSEIGRFVLVQDGEYKQDNYTAKVNSFLIGKTPVTQQQWQAIMDKNPSHFKGANHPVEQVNWYDAVEFCNKMSEKYGLEACYTIDKKTQDPNNKSDYDNIKWLVTFNPQAKGFRLPTEAEWKFAAQGGNQSKGYEFAGSDKIDEVAWYEKNSKKSTQAVAQLNANELGIYDMSGNVWEWCYDWYDTLPQKFLENPTGPTKGEYKVLCGGSWYNGSTYCRLANRISPDADDRSYDIGFRICLSL